MEQRIVYTAEETAQSYMDSIDNISRIEYIRLLGEANDEGRVAKALGSAIETKELWGAQEFWAPYNRELREEFYIAYRRGYINSSIVKGDG